jgi:glycosyltransferase involved in cell wall biosynthesis
MSCFNAEKWVAATLESVLAQTYVNFEFVVVNDGSMDRTLEILRAFAARDSRVIILDKPNSGLADSLNFGLEAASGEWIARIDADDLCAPQRLEAQVTYVTLHPDVVLLGSGFVEIDALENVVAEHKYPGKSSDLVARLETLRAFFPHSSAFYRRDLAKQLGGYRSQIKRAEDWDLWLRFSELGRLACLDASLVKIRKHEGGISNEAGGLQQLVDVHVATTCYFLRRFGAEDPMEKSEPNERSHFIDWMRAALADAKIFERRKAWTEARMAFFRHDSRTAASASFVFDLLRSRHALGLIREKLFGSSLPLSLARVHIQKAQVEVPGNRGWNC